MLDFEHIKNQYPAHLQVFERAILREYLQVKILQALFESKHASQVAFIGGTALRILFDNQRFSEDIDLDNYGLSWDAFGEMIQKVRSFLTSEGFIVEMREIQKGAFHCDIRFPELLYFHGLTPHVGQKILIRVDTVAQEYDYHPMVRILNQFDVFTEIRVAPLPVLLSQKIFALINRKRPKGRDFYDITFLLGMVTPDYGYIRQKMEVDSPEELRLFVLDRIKSIDFEDLAGDVAPFLIDNTQVNRVKLFKTFWQQADLG